MSKSKKKKAAAKRKKIEKKNRSTKSQVLQLSSDAPPTINPEIPDNVTEVDAHFYPYDENLLDRSRTQWEFGDWQTLAEIEQDTLQHHPDRAKLALLVAAGHSQQGDLGSAHYFIRLAQSWGCSQRLISQVLVAGVHNSLARAAVSGGYGARALKHFEAAITTGIPGSNRKFQVKARVGQQLKQLNLSENTNELQPEFCTKTIPLCSPLIDGTSLQKLPVCKEENEELLAVANAQITFLKNQLEQERQAQESALEKERELSKDLVLQVEQLNRQIDGIRTELEHQVVVTQKKERYSAEIQQQVTDLQKRNQLLQGENDLLKQRQDQLENELIKAEAQINIIKDLMLND